MRKTPQPPPWATRLFRWWGHPDTQEEVQGDLLELYAYWVQTVGERRANWCYIVSILKLLRPLSKPKRSSVNPSSFLLRPAMLRNYVRIAFRQLWKNPVFSAVNLIGLTVGLSVSTFIALYVWHEFHYDRFEPFANRTYRITSVEKYGSEDISFPYLHESFGREVKRQIPDVESIVRWSGGPGDVVLQSDATHKFKEKDIGFADASILPVMGLKLIRGDARTALREPGKIILTRALAKKYFGIVDPIGKTLVFNKHFPLTVSGVLADLPTNSVIQFNALVSLQSMPTLGAQRRDMYERAGFLSTFLVLRPKANASLVERKLEQVKAGIKFANVSAKYLLEALPSLHLDSRSTSKDSRQSLYILLTIALIILALAVINYVSLTTALATKRAKEVGIRKAIGGQRRELIGQFFLESFLVTTLAFLLSLALLRVFFPWANQSLDLHMDSRVLEQGPYWGLILSLWLGCSLLAGAYPAGMLSGFRPALVLKGATNMRFGGARLRQVFTTVQFTACIGLLICSIVLYTQMRFLRTKNLGINREQVVSVYIDGEMVPQFPALRDAVRQWAGNGNVAVTNTRLFTDNIMTYFLKTEKTKKDLMVGVLTVDKPFFDMMGVHWKYPPEGWSNRPVTKELTTYNQTVVKEAGIAGNPLQQPAPFEAFQPTDGVVADFHVRSLHGPVSPMMLTVVSDTNRSIIANGGYLLVRLKPQTNVPEALDQLKTIYNRSQSTTPFDYYFLDDAYNKLYAKEERLARLFNGFTALTLLVACLGLLGLMTFSVEVRTKEIGIRKVLGASVSSLATLLSKDFLKLILLAILIASPLAWWAMNKWLQDFAYKIDIAWWVFALAGLGVVTIALLTVSFQSVKAALMNPVKSLRNE